MKKIVAILLLGLSLSMAQTTVTFWSSIDSEPIQKLIADFNAEHADINVELVNAGSYNDMITRMQAAVVSKRLLDEFFIMWTKQVFTLMEPGQHHVGKC